MCSYRDSNSENTGSKAVVYANSTIGANYIVRMMGIEPTRLTATDFKSVMYYQFHHIRMLIVESVGIEPIRSVCKTDDLPLASAPI